MVGHEIEMNPGLSICMPRMRNLEMYKNQCAGMVRSVCSLMSGGKHQTEEHFRLHQIPVPSV